ncbi:MAG: DUF4384 domain-containing protein [Nitrospirae bacterium]|nr:MAG: DUF4384 domain-containing protein [Nitrospirota bacterium]
MKKPSHIVFILVLFLLPCRIVDTPLYAAQSTIVEAEGYACMGDDKSRKQTEQSAMTDAKRKAAEKALTYIQSETRIKDMELEKDLVSAYADAQVKVIDESVGKWYKEAATGECYKLSIKAEVIPDTKAIDKMSQGDSYSPTAPLNVRVWTEKKDYKQGEKIKIYIQGNKPFYARVLYADVKGEMLQLLPNPYRTDNYFNGGVVYEIPSGGDKYELEVSPPFGEENVIIYSSTSQLGDINLKTEGGVYYVDTKAKDIGNKTRSVKIKSLSDKKSVVSEFYEGKATVRTGN